MASQLTSEEVARIAELARLALTPEEAATFRRELTAILAYAEDIQRVNTDNVPPASGAAPAAWREDEPVPTLGRDAVLEQAPDAATDAGLFRVPKVL